MLYQTVVQYEKKKKFSVQYSHSEKNEDIKKSWNAVYISRGGRIIRYIIIEIARDGDLSWTRIINP